MSISEEKFTFNSLWTKLDIQGWVDIGIFEYEAGK